MSVTPKSGKAKGRRLQNRVRQNLIECLGLPADAVRCKIMGETGVDLEINPTRAPGFPYGIECGNQERVNLWAKWDQTVTNARKELRIPLLVLSKNRTEPVVVMSWGHFLGLLEGVARSSEADS